MVVMLELSGLQGFWLSAYEEEQELWCHVFALPLLWPSPGPALWR